MGEVRRGSRTARSEQNVAAPRFGCSVALVPRLGGGACRDRRGQGQAQREESSKQDACDDRDWFNVALTPAV